MSAAAVARSELVQDEAMDQTPAKASTSKTAAKNRKKAAPPAANSKQPKDSEKKPANHPKYSDMIRQAVAALHDRGGSSRQALLKYIMTNFDVGSETKTINNHLKMALRAGVKNGTLQQAKGTGASGSFKVGVKVKAHSVEGRVKKPKAIKTAKSPAKAKPKAQKASGSPAAKKTKAPQTSAGPAAKKAKTEKPSSATTAKTAAKTAKVSNQAQESKAPKSQKATTVQPTEAAKSAKPVIKPSPKAKAQKSAAKRPAAKGKKPASTAEDQSATSPVEDAAPEAEDTAADAEPSAQEASPSNEAAPTDATTTTTNAAPTAKDAGAATDSQLSAPSGQEPTSEAVPEKGASKSKQTGRGRKGGAKNAAQR